MRYQRNRSDTDLKKYIDILDNYVILAQEKDTIDGLMGVEGTGARMYFEAYGKLLRNGFEFRKREYHPPPDPVSALLSFGYMLIFNEIDSLLEAFGFDVFLGFLHSVSYGRESLASDLMEELRAPVADRLVLYLINKGAVRISQFESDEKGVRMNDICLKTFLSNYEDFMTASFYDRQAGEYITYREIIRKRVRNLERAVLDSTDYVPYVFSS